MGCKKVLAQDGQVACSVSVSSFANSLYLRLFRTFNWIFPTMNVVSVNQLHTQSWTCRAKTFVQSASTVTLLVGGIVSSAALLYHKPQQWLLTTTSACLISFYTIPKVLRHGNTLMVKTALVISLATAGSLALGGSIVASLIMGRVLITSCQISSLTAVLFSSFFFTGFVGYAIPHSYAILQKSYNMINHSYWHARFDYLTQHFNHLPQLGHGFLQTNILPSVCLHAALIAPNLLQSTLQRLDIEITPQLQAMITNSRPAGPDQLDIIQRFFEHLPTEPLHPQNRERNESIAIVLDRLKHTLNYLTPEALNEEIDLLLNQCRQTVPHILSTEEFLSLFQGKIAAVMNTKIDHFLNQMINLPILQEHYNQLITESEELRVSIEEQRALNRDRHTQRLLMLDQRYVHFRLEIENLHKQKQNWKSFYSILEETDHNLFGHFARIEELEQLLQNQGIMNAFESLHLSLYGFNPQEELPLIERLQRIKNLLDENATLKAWSFLGSDQCNFDTDDYHELCEWLRIHSFNDIEAKMAEIGLITEEDLYTNTIIPHHSITISKEQIKSNLQQYINEKLESKGTFRNRAYRAIAHVGKIQVGAISKKVSQAIYRAITMGLILVPVCLYPIPAGIGFGCGLIYFILKRFGRDLDAADARGNALFRNRITEIITNFSTERNFFSLSPQSRENMDTFTRSDLFGRMRAINFEILATMAITYLPDILCNDLNPTNDILGLGGFIQGSVLAKEVVNLF